MFRRIITDGQTDFISDYWLGISDYQYLIFNHDVEKIIFISLYIIPIKEQACFM